MSQTIKFGQSDVMSEEARRRIKEDQRRQRLTALRSEDEDDFELAGSVRTSGFRR